MRFYLLLLLIVCFVANSYAQLLNGTVKDAATRLPISNAQIITEGKTIFTDGTGRFVLPAKNKSGDRFAVRLMGYKTIEVTLKEDFKNDTIRVFLNPNAVDLKEVVIKSQRNYKLDSANLRKEYAKEFNYKALQLKDVLIKKDPNYRSPFPSANPNSTASILSFDVLNVIGLLGKRSNQKSKFQKHLLVDEQEKYVAYFFSKEKVSAVTKLQGDSLLLFMNRYRPTPQEAKLMTSYELNLYIKKSYADFLKKEN